MAKGCGMTVVGEYDPAAIRKAEDEALAKRSAEESGPVATLYTPVVCVKRGLPLDQAATMHPEDLTPADAKFLVGKGVTLPAIGDLYCMIGQMTYAFMVKHGIKKANVPDYPWTSVTVVQEAAPKAEPVKVLTPADLTREAAARLLLDGVSKLEISKRYRFANDPAIYLRLTRWGLHKKDMPAGKRERKEETKRMAQAVLEEIEREKNGIKWHEDASQSGNVTIATNVITEAERQDLFGDGPGEALPPIKLAPENLQYLKELEDALAPDGDSEPGEALPADEIRGCITCGHIDIVPYTHCNMTTQNIRDCIDADYLGWIPRTSPISDAVKHAAAVLDEIEREKEPKSAPEEKQVLFKPDAGCPLGVDHRCYRQECLENACPDLARRDEEINRLRYWYKQAGLIDEKGNYHPEGPISDAVHQAAATGEIKAATREVPTPAPTIDLASMHRFVPGPCGFGKQVRTITIGKEGTIRLSAGLVLAGPAEIRDPGSKFPAAVYVNDDGRTVAVHPEDGGAVFNGAKDGTAKKATAKPVINYLVEAGIGLPATYQAQWSAVDGAWIGRIVEKAG